jgi:O-methyltransferase
MKPVIIYGAGCQGTALLRRLNLLASPPQVLCFIDGNPARQGQTIAGHPIHGPDYLKTVPSDEYLILVAVGRHYVHIRDRLRALGRKEHLHFQQADSQPADFTTLQPEFADLLQDLRGLTLLSDDRLAILFQLANMARHIPGAIAEVGVYRGGTALLMARALAGAGKPLHLFDTFSGIPETDTDLDHHCPGDFNDTSLEKVRRLLDPFPGTHIHPGRFPETVPDTLRDQCFALVHVDVDVYGSALDCCAFFASRLSPGGMLLLDDYGFESCPGIRRAVDEFFTGKEQRPLYLPTGQALFWHPGTIAV